MMLFIILLAVFLATLLTLFSGFGLGTILMPLYAVFYPLDMAIAMTAVVHFMSNVFKLVLLGKHADRRIVLAFGLPGILAALAGAWLLLALQDLQPLWVYQMGGHDYQIMPVKLAVAFLMGMFAILELLPSFQKLSFDQRYLPLGGVASGFIGGLSGHQGALRSAFLMRCGLSQETIIATGVVIACLVDVSRLSVYGTHFARIGFDQNGGLLLLSVLAALVGVIAGRHWMKRMTLPLLQKLVAGMLIVIALLLGAGII